VTSAPTQRGLGLIELMVTIALIGILAAVAAPFSINWGNQSAVQSSKALLLQGMAQAKAMALRNGAGASNDQPAAWLLSTGSQLCVYTQLPSSLACGSATWKASPSASLTLQGASSQCIALNSLGSPLSAVVGSTTCGTTLTYTLSKGNESSTGTLF